MEALEKLVRMVPPPKHPVEVGDNEAFAIVERELGVALPSDFKRLIQSYGSGQWQDFWYVLNPFSANRYLNLVQQATVLRPAACSTLDAERTGRESEPASYPHLIYPEPGGILPWAVTDNGGRLFWITAGPPAHWRTVYYADRSPDFESYNISCTQLVYGAVSGELPIFAGALGEDHRYGEPGAFKSSAFQI